jgi:hypothetical protein
MCARLRVFWDVACMIVGSRYRKRVPPGRAVRGRSEWRESTPAASSLQLNGRARTQKKVRRQETFRCQAKGEGTNERTYGRRADATRDAGRIPTVHMPGNERSIRQLAFPAAFATELRLGTAVGGGPNAGW